MRSSVHTSPMNMGLQTGSKFPIMSSPATEQENPEFIVTWRIPNRRKWTDSGTVDLLILVCELIDHLGPSLLERFLEVLRL